MFPANLTSGHLMLVLVVAEVKVLAVSVQVVAVKVIFVSVPVIILDVVPLEVVILDVVPLACVKSRETGWLVSVDICIGVVVKFKDADMSFSSDNVLVRVVETFADADLFA